MRLLTIGVLFILFTSCGKNYCIKNFPCPPDSINVQNITTVDTLWQQMPADTTYIQTPIDCPDQQIIVKDGKVTTRIVIKDKLINVYRTTKADSIMILSLKRQVKEYERQIQIKKEQVIVYKNKPWVKYLIYYSILLSLFTAFRYRKLLFSWLWV